MGVLWLDEVDKDDIPIVGGKAANLGELLRVGIPVPEGFVVDGKTFMDFIESSGLKEKIVGILNSINVEDTKQLEEASKKIREMIESTPMPKDVEKEIRQAYRKLCEEAGEEVFVAVRSSATAEDLPGASFAGQQETYLNVRGEDEVVEKVRKCWSSLYTPRAIYYRVQKGFRHEDVSIAVVVQKMVNSEKSGVMFTSHPVTGDKIAIVEAVWGLGEAIVSGMVTPDHYEYDRVERRIKKVQIAEKKFMLTRGEDGKTVKVELPPEKAKARVLSDSEIEELVKLGEIIEEHYGTPQDVEWAIEKGRIYIVQSRPITTIREKMEEVEVEEGKILLKGLGASPGIGVGKVKIVLSADEIDKVEEGDVLVTTMTTPDMVPAMRKASAIVTDEGGLTCIEGDARVLTDRGFMKIRDVYELVKRGERLKVLGINAKTLKTEWKDVVDAQRRMARRYEICVYMKNITNDTIKITPDHNFPIFKDGRLQKVSLEEIVERGYAVLSIDRIPMIEDRFEALADVMYLCGAIMADGHVIRRKNGKAFRVRFTQKECEAKREFIEKVLEDVRKIGGEFIEIGRRNDVVEYQTSRKRPSELMGFVENSLRILPLYANEEELLDFLAGYVDGDGCVGKRLEIYENANATDKIECLILALYRVGAVPRLRFKGGTAVISAQFNVDGILERTKRMKRKLGKRFTKLFNMRQTFPNVKDGRGFFWKYYKQNLFVSLEKVEGFVDEKFLELLKNSDVYNVRIAKVGEDFGEVYNLTVKAENEFDHNYIVWTRRYTPIVVFNCHAAIVSRELGVPAVVGTEKATKVLKDGMIVTVDGEKGIVYAGALKEKKKEEKPAVVAQAPIITATEVKVNISIPDAAERAAATGADGVGLFRIEHMVLGLKKHPMKYIRDGEIEEYINELYKGMKKVVQAFYPKPVWIRTLDAPTDEFRAMEGGEDEPIEANPMLGFRGIRRDLKEEEHFRAEIRAIKKLVDEGYTNIGIMLPLVTSPEEVRKAKRIIEEEGLPLDKIEFGIMVETPAAALIIEDIIKEGIDFVSLGTNDLTQYTLAVDRNNENVAYLYNEEHPAVMKLIERVIKICKKHGVKTSICGQAGSYPHVVEKLVRMGIDSVSANPDAVQRIREVVARVERKIILEKIRELSDRGFE